MKWCIFVNDFWNRDYVIYNDSLIKLFGETDDI